MSFSFKKFLSTLAVKKDDDTGEMTGAESSHGSGRQPQTATHNTVTEKGIDILSDCNFRNLNFNDPENILESPQKLKPSVNGSNNRDNIMSDNVREGSSGSSDEDIAIPENVKHILQKIENIQLHSQGIENSTESSSSCDTQNKSNLIQGDIGKKLLLEYEKTMDVIRSSLSSTDDSDVNAATAKPLYYQDVLKPSSTVSDEEPCFNEHLAYKSYDSEIKPPAAYKEASSSEIINESPQAAAELASAKKTEKEEVGNKVWREGMPEKSVVANDPSKTLFMSQNFNKNYEEADKKFKGPSFEKSIQKLSREINYFNRILVQVDDDVKNTEYRVKNPDKVVMERSRMKAELNALKEKITLFIDDVLSGDIRTEAPAKAEVVKDVPESTQIEYVFPYDKKINKDTEGCKLVNKCSDCGIQIVHSSSMTMEEAMLEHSKTAEHRAIVPEKIQKKAVEMPTSMSPFSSSQPQQKKPTPTQDEVKIEKLMSLHRIMICLIDDNLLNCLPCGINVSQDSLAAHCNEETHCNNLNSYYCRQQKELVAQNPDTFGFNKNYYVSDAHIVIHKLFVNPFEKYAYCGICNKELPCSMKPIDGHITSKNHDRLLKEALEKKEGGIAFVDGKLVDTNDTKNNVEPTVQDNNSQVLDVAALEVFLEGKQTKTDVNAVNVESSPEKKVAKSEKTMLDKALYKALGMSYGIVSRPDSKFDCTICDVKRLTNATLASNHAHSTVHKANSKNKLKAMTPEQQEQLLNMTSPYLLAAILSNENNDKASKPQTENKRPVKIITHRVMPNGFYCIVCKANMNNVNEAFEHTKAANHVNYQIDSVTGSLNNTFYKCEKCNVKISGEKNAVGHIVGVKHKMEGKSVAASAKINIPEKSRAKKNENLPNSWRNEAKFMPTDPEEVALFERNGIVPSRPSGSFICNYCCIGLQDREQMYEHMFSYQHSNAIATMKH